MYKCCWNCANSAPAACKTKEERDRLRASKRFCCALYPVSNKLENPFKQRYCKQFEPQFAFHPFYSEITKKEADRLQQMTADELAEYWSGTQPQREDVCGSG